MKWLCSISLSVHECCTASDKTALDSINHFNNICLMLIHQCILYITYATSSSTQYSHHGAILQRNCPSLMASLLHAYPTSTSLDLESETFPKPQPWQAFDPNVIPAGFLKQCTTKTSTSYCRTLPAVSSNVHSHLDNYCWIKPYQDGFKKKALNCHPVSDCYQRLFLCDGRGLPHRSHHPRR